jgi:hypothetical protein
LIFLTAELTNERYLVDTGATLSIVPCNQNSSPPGPLLAPFSKGQMNNQSSPLGVSLKNYAISRQAFYSQFSASHCGWSHSEH